MRNGQNGGCREKHKENDQSVIWGVILILISLGLADELTHFTLFPTGKRGMV